MDIFYQLIQSTYVYLSILLIVALGGLLAERSGVTNIALEGIMIFGAFVGIFAVKTLEIYPYQPIAKIVIVIVSILFAALLLWMLSLLVRKVFKINPETWTNYTQKKSGKLTILAIYILVAAGLSLWIMSIEVQKNFILILGLMVGGLFGGLYAMIHAYASIYMKANQIISATALNLFAPALAIFTARVIQGGQQIGFTTNFMINKVPVLGDIPVIGDLFFTRVYLSFYIALAALVMIWYVIYKTKFGLRLRACGENPHAADSLGINIYKLRFKAVTLSGVFAGMGGVIFVVTTSTEFNVTVDGFGFLAIAVLIFGNWRPSKILLAAMFFGFMRTIASAYLVIPSLSNLGLPSELYNIIPYIATLVILAFFSKNSRAPKALGQIYDQGSR